MFRNLVAVLMLAALAIPPSFAGGDEPASPTPDQSNVWTPVQTLTHEAGSWRGLNGPLLASDGKNLGLLVPGADGMTLAVYRPSASTPGGAGGTGQWALGRDIPLPDSQGRHWTSDGTLVLEGNTAVVALTSGDGRGMAFWTDLADLAGASTMAISGQGQTFGDSATMDGRILAVSDPGAELVQLERVDGTSTTASGATVPTSTALASVTQQAGRTGADFGDSVAMDQGMLAISATAQPANGVGGAGVVDLYSFGLNGTTYLQTIESPAPKAHGQFGRIVHLEGDTLAVMEPNNGQPEAIVYLFQSRAGVWELETRVAVPRSQGANTVIMDLDGDTLIAGTSDNRHTSEVRIWSRGNAGWALDAVAPVSILSGAPHDLVLLPDGWAAVSEPTQGTVVVDIFGRLPVPASECQGCLRPDAPRDPAFVENGTLPAAPPRQGAVPALPVTVPCAPVVEGVPESRHGRSEEGNRVFTDAQMETTDVVAAAAAALCLTLDLPLTPTIPAVVQLPQGVQLTYDADVSGVLRAEARISVDAEALAHDVPALAHAQVYIEVEAAPGAVAPELRQVTIEAQIAPGTTGVEMGLHYWNGARWVDLASAVGTTVPGEAGGEPLRVFATGTDEATGTVWAKVDHTSVYALAPRAVAPPAPLSGFAFAAGMLGALVLLAAVVGGIGVLVARRDR